MNKCVTLMRKTLGADHIEVSRSKQQLGTMQLTSRDFKKAARNYRESLRIAEEVSYYDHLQLYLQRRISIYFFYDFPIIYVKFFDCRTKIQFLNNLIK